MAIVLLQESFKSAAGLQRAKEAQKQEQKQEKKSGKKGKKLQDWCSGNVSQNCKKTMQFLIEFLSDAFATVKSTTLKGLTAAASSVELAKPADKGPRPAVSVELAGPRAVAAAEFGPGYFLNLRS